MKTSVKASKSRGSMRQGRAHGFGGPLAAAVKPRAPFKPAPKKALAPPPNNRGRKPMSPTGEIMAARKIRMTDSDWEDAKLVGAESIRVWIRKAAAKQRSKQR